LLASSVGAAATSAAKEAAKTMQEYQVGLLFRGETKSAEAARWDSESVLKTITARKVLSESG
jgi:hypothetical protein